MKILRKIDLFQKEINTLRPLEGEILEQIKDYYRVGLTWTSNALEGNSLTESETKVLLEDGLTVGGKPLRDLFEAVDHDRKIYKADLPHRAIAVYMYLQNRANKEGFCYPAIGTIAKELHLSVSTVKRAVRDLEESGYIRKTQRWRENGGRSSLLFELLK